MISIYNDRKEALTAGWKALKERSPDIEGNEFTDFEIRALKDDKEAIGMILTRGSELHVAIIPSYRRRWLSQRIIKQVFGELLEKYGYVTTSVMEDNFKGIDFVERLGFKKESISKGIIYYRMNS